MHMYAQEIASQGILLGHSPIQKIQKFFVSSRCRGSPFSNRVKPSPLTTSFFLNMAMSLGV